MKKEVQNSIVRALRKEFDDDKTSHLRLKEILETVKQLGFIDTWQEMLSDLISMGIVKSDSWYKHNNDAFIE